VVAVKGIPVTGVSELVLEVADLQASERFYAGVLGLPVVEHWTDPEAIWRGRWLYVTDPDGNVVEQGNRLGDRVNPVPEALSNVAGHLRTR
jgi:catechol 2,3-dioxygenase-like lactoylglutathione lyase family enzyme